MNLSRVAMIAACLGAAWTAAAGPLDGPLPGAIYAGEPESPDAAARVAAALSQLTPPVSLETPPAHVAQFAAVGTTLVLGAPVAEGCQAEPVGAGRYHEDVDALYRAILAGQETPQLVADVQRIRASQPCLSEPVEASALARVEFLHGVVLASDQNRDAARSAFDQVLAVDPT